MKTFKKVIFLGLVVLGFNNAAVACVGTTTPFCLAGLRPEWKWCNYSTGLEHEIICHFEIGTEWAGNWGCAPNPCN